MSVTSLVLSVLVTTVLSGTARAESGPDYQNLRGKVRYVDPSSIGTCLGAWPTLNQAMSHERYVRDLLPMRDLEEIRIAGDAVSLPAEIVLLVLTQARVMDGGSPSQRRFIPVHVRFRGGRCLEVKFFPSYKYQVYHQALVGSAWCDTSLLRKPGSHLDLVKDLKEGHTTRGELSKNFYPDGGISVPFRSERFVAKNVVMKGRVMKMNVAFRPAGRGKKMSDQDVVSRVSPLYMDYPITD